MVHKFSVITKAFGYLFFLIVFFVSLQAIASLDVDTFLPFVNDEGKDPSSQIAINNSDQFNYYQTAIDHNNVPGTELSQSIRNCCLVSTRTRLCICTLSVLALVIIIFIYVWKALSRYRYESNTMVS